MSAHDETTATSPGESYIKALYRGVLKRDADPPGLEFFLERLGANPSFEEAASLLFAFIEGQENARLTLIPELNGLAKDRHFKNVISIGTHCITSAMLKKFGLKDFSGPFDWIFSSVGMVTHCLADDFSTFLDRELHAAIPIEQRAEETVNLCDHVYYRDAFGVGAVFNHYDVLEDEHYQYYVRCVERFRSAIASPDKSLLVCITNAVSDEEFLGLCEPLAGSDNATVLCVRTIPDRAGEFGMANVAEHGRHRLYEMRLRGDLGPVNFTDVSDTLLFYSLLASALAPKAA